MGWRIFHIKVLFWLSILLGFIYMIYRNKSRLLYRCKEVATKLRRRFGGRISLNESFHTDLEAGLSSRNFDIISQNSEDNRAGLDDDSKNDIKKIMDLENISFDKARLIYMERKFGQNGIAPDGTPMDPKAVTFT